MAGKAAPKKERAWTETELKYLALVLADEKNQFAVRLDTLALKKSANNEVFEDISKVFQSCLLSNEFIEENDREKRKGKRRDSPLQITPARLRIKYKWLRSQWRMLTDRVKKGSGKAPIKEPEWFTILNPIFSDTMGDMDVATSPGDVLPYDSDDSFSDEESEHVRPDDTSSTSNPEPDVSANSELDSSSSSGTKRKTKERGLNAKPCAKKRVKTQTQAIHEMAKSFTDLGEFQQKRSQMMVEADKERQAVFLNFQREQAELNRQHELKMMELLMKITNIHPSAHCQHAPTQMAQQPTTHSYYNSVTASGFQQLSPPQPDPSQVAASQASHLTDLDYPPSSSMGWY